MKNLKIEHKILIIVIIVLLITILTSQLINTITDKSLINETKKVISIIEKEKIDFVGSIAYKINNNITLENKVISNDVSGKGIIYYDDKGSITVVLQDKNKCAIKLAESNDITVLNEKCPKYEFLQGAKVRLGKEDTIKKYKDTYVYSGKYAENYIVYNNEYWRIVSFSDQGIKIISEYAMAHMPYSTNGSNDYLKSDIYEFLNSEYASIQPDILKSSWDIGSSIGDKKNNINKKEKEDTTEAKIGILTLSDYLNSIDGGNTCETTEESLICTSDTYITSNNDLWLMTSYSEDKNKAWSTNTKYNMYVDDVAVEKDIRPVIVLDKRYKIINGYGTKENPYILTKLY